MPLLDIAISQPCSCFRNNILAFRSEAHFHNKLVVGNDRGLGFLSAFSWKPFRITEKVGEKSNLGRVERWRGGLTIKSVATLEIASVSHKSEGVKGHPNMSRVEVDSLRSNSSALKPQSSSEDSTEVTEREKLRRMRISKAIKGNTPWNKGRKHSPETLQRIRERTRLAMQNPKVKMKLLNLGHAQSEETKMKIAVGVRLGWERRREKLMLQETCHYEWQDLIAEAARKGIFGEEELQWDSYKTLDGQIEQEWLQSVEERKHTPRPTGSKRAPKSANQKRKISEAISAKWTDPEYGDRVRSSLARYHGISEGVERKPRRPPSGEGRTRIRSPPKDDTDKHETKIRVQRVRLRSKASLYKDPFASSKLEMLKNIRAQRAAPVNPKTEAISRAKLLIAEAEKATRALEMAAKNSLHVQTSLTESRMLIAEAIQFIQSVETENLVPYQHDDDLSENSTEPLPHVEEDMDANAQSHPYVHNRKVNGVHSLSAIETKVFCFNKVVMPYLNGSALSSCHTDLHKPEQQLHQTSTNTLVMNLDDPKPYPNGCAKFASESTDAQKEQTKIIKKWVRGRLVEVVKEA